MQKNIKFYLILFLAGVTSLIAVRFILADDNEVGKEDQPTVTKSTSANSSSSGSGSTKTETKVTTDVVTKTTVQKDSDGDGLLDGNDPHPNIPEIYIVVDDNKNGIVDQFEK